MDTTAKQNRVTKQNLSISQGLVAPKDSLLKVLVILLCLFCALSLSRSVLPESNYSPFWPVTGVALALSAFSSTRLAILIIPTVFLWGFFSFSDNWLTNSALSTLSAVVPLIWGTLLRYKWIKTSGFLKMSYSSRTGYLLLGFGLFAVSLPSALLSTSIVNHIGLYSAAGLLELLSIYWLSEFAGCVLFFPLVILFLQPYTPQVHKPDRMFVISLLLLLMLGVAGLMLPGLYKQIAIFIGLPLLTIYALSTGKPLFVQLALATWSIFSMYVAAEIPLVEGEFNDILFMSGIVLLLTSSGVTLQAMWLMSERRRLLVSALKRQSRVDMRTELLNERGINDALKNLDNINYQAVVVRLHQSKAMIESLGPNTLPTVFREIAKRLNDHLENVQMAGLVSGSSILTIVEKGKNAVNLQAADMIKALTDENFLADKSLSISELDIACLSFSGHQTQRLLEKLSIASYLASQNPIQRYYEADINDNSLEEPIQNFKRFQEIKQWLDEGRLTLWGQHIKCISHSSKVDKIELLARIVSPDKTLLFPDTFLPLFGQFGFQSEFDKYVLKKGFSMLKNKKDDNVFFNINVSATSFAEHSFPEFIQSLLTIHNINPSQCGFELTETDALPNVQSTTKNVKLLNKMGFEIGLDDFGTGFANYAYLLDIPFNFVKLDGRFIKDIKSNESSLDTVKAIVGVARHCNMKTIAEYVENSSVEEILKSLDVDYAQGYGISKPAPIDEC